MRHQPLNTDGKTLESHRQDEHTTGVGPASRCLSEDEVMRLCAGDIAEEHLPRIDEHLDRCEACQRWVAEVMAHGETNPADDDPADDDASLHPSTFRAGTMAAGRFRIIQFIKRGGMGEVYEAFDSVLETRVALKTILSTACDSPRAVRKLKAEVQLARSIRHPNVCSVFDIWEHHSTPGDSSVYFFTMEFIAGLTLRQVLQRSLFELDETLRIARLELLGLRAAHDSGVVHRDFKSDNVMLRSDRRDESQVVVMDFGLARALQKEGAPSNDSEQFAGSVAYMAPEQVEGRRPIGPQADVFAFGVVLFEMLTGQLPWVGDSPWTTAALRLTQRAPPPSRLRPGLAPRIDAFVLKCLNREPADRFKDAREALAAFEELSGPAPRRTQRWVLGAVAAALPFIAALGLQQRTASNVSALQPSGRAENANELTAPLPGSATALTAAAPAAPAVEVDGAPFESKPLPSPATQPEPRQRENVAVVSPTSGRSANASAAYPEAFREPPRRRREPRPEQQPSDARAKALAPSSEPASSSELASSSEPASAAPPAASSSSPAPSLRDAAAGPTNALTPSAVPAGRGEHAPGAPLKLRGFE